MKHGHILILILLGAGMICCTCNKGYGANSSVKRILQAHKTGEWDLDVSKLSRLSETPNDFLKRMSGRIEVHRVPPPSNVADAFVYDIILAKKGQRFWIRRTGGFAGVNELYGVGVLQKDGTIKYVKPTGGPDKK